GYVAARTAEEEIVAGIWMQVMGLDRVGVIDNFFELGGHSLLATQVMSRVREAFQIDILLKVLFERPTVEELVESIRDARAAGTGQQPQAIARTAREGNLPLSFAQQRLWFIEQLVPGRSVFNIPVVVRLIGDLKLEALEKSFNQIIERHEALRTTFGKVDGSAVQKVHSTQYMRLPIIKLSKNEAKEEQIHRRLAETIKQPFNLTELPLIRVELLKLSKKEHILVLVMHHIVTDGWSLGIFIKELTCLYEANLKGEPSPLQELEIQYADYACWQREWFA